MAAYKAPYISELEYFVESFNLGLKLVFARCLVRSVLNRSRFKHFHVSNQQAEYKFSSSAIPQRSDSIFASSSELTFDLILSRIALIFIFDCPSLLIKPIDSYGFVYNIVEFRLKNKSEFHQPHHRNTDAMTPPSRLAAVISATGSFARLLCRL